MEFQGTERLPYLFFDELEGKLILKGRSIVTDPIEFYEPLLNRLDEYLTSPKDINVVIELEYFNTRSAKYLLQMMKKLESVALYGFKCTLEWRYEADDLTYKESGEDFADMCPKIEFKFVEI